MQERVEVLVDRGGLHAEAAGDLGHAERIDTVLGHHISGDTKDLVDRLSAPTRPSVKRRGGHRIG